MIQLKVTGVSRRSSSEVSTRKFTYPEDKPRIVEQFNGAIWEEIEFQLLPEEKPVISVANIEGSGYLVGNVAKILINDPALFGTFKTGDVINFIPNIETTGIDTTGSEVQEPPAETPPQQPVQTVITATAEEPASIVVPKIL